jgi:hypothetical protein
MTVRRFIAWLGLALVLGSASSTAAARAARFAEVAPVLARLADILPAALKNSSGASGEQAWDTWIAQHDREIRQRLVRGDADTVVNWLLFGTTFTAQPRAVPAALPADLLAALVGARAHDLVIALMTPGSDERRAFARQTLEAHGVRFTTPEQRTEAERYLSAEVDRVLSEWQRYASELEQDRRLGDPSADLAARSKLFRDRGLSLDTSLPPNFAIEQALSQLKARRLLDEGSVAHAAIIGPGLDFSDKNAGYDFYPEQTVQPFMLLDSLRRLRLAPRQGLPSVTTFDISPRVNAHLNRARRAAERGGPYILHLAIDGSIPWKQEFLAYWRHAGDAIGGASIAERPPAILGPSVQARAIQIKADATRHITPEDLNIVAQRDDDAAFDLIVATNVLVYYDTLDQSLALANIAAMLKRGGFLLTNNAVLELPEIGIKSTGYTTVAYSDRRDDGDHVVWYRRQR